MTVEERMKQEYEAARFYLKQSEKFRGRREFEKMEHHIDLNKESMEMYMWLKELKTLRQAREDAYKEIKRRIEEEAEYAYADFEQYKADVLNSEQDELPDDDFRYGMQRALEIVIECWPRGRESEINTSE
ncbi:MAG: hypothetical protein IKM88_00855 [Lachnospiraceae bacterium]|nr:hypothetical protein [Lachnospiraceae bacterium]